MSLAQTSDWGQAMSDGPTRARRNDPGLRAISNDPELEAAMEQMAKEDARAAVEYAIACTEERTLKGWVAVAQWEDESGHISNTVIRDDHSSSLEIKGFLHDGVWDTAHAD